MARITATTQKKNTMMPGMAYPATVLALATAAQLPSIVRLIQRALAYPLATPDSIRVLDWADPVVSLVPAAVHEVAEMHDTPLRLLLGPRLGLGTIDQAVPSNDIISVFLLAPTLA